MSITAKQLAEKLGLSQTAISMALNNKQGVSTTTRKQVLEAAKKYGYDFSRITSKDQKTGSIYVIFYISHNALVSFSPIFNELIDKTIKSLKKNHYSVKTLYFYEKLDNLSSFLTEIQYSDCVGLLILGTELTEASAKEFTNLNLPMVILDNYFKNIACDYVLIDNYQGAYAATQYLILKRNQQPGYLISSLSIHNFRERYLGFKTALHDSGMSTSHIITHQLAPSVEGAFCDMLEIINQGQQLASCYVADNDLIAIGAMKALQTQNYKIPEDIGIIGFDNISRTKITTPALSTVNVPLSDLAQYSVNTLLTRIKHPERAHTKLQVSTSLCNRFSI